MIVNTQTGVVPLSKEVCVYCITHQGADPLRRKDWLVRDEKAWNDVLDPRISCAYFECPMRLEHLVSRKQDYIRKIAPEMLSSCSCVTSSTVFSSSAAGGSTPTMMSSCCAVSTSTYQTTHGKTKFHTAVAPTPPARADKSRFQQLSERMKKAWKKVVILPDLFLLRVCDWVKPK